MAARGEVVIGMLSSSHHHLATPNSVLLQNHRQRPLEMLSVLYQAHTMSSTSRRPLFVEELESF